MSQEIDLTKLKVADLKRLCKERGFPGTGSKAELLGRLNQHEDDDAVLHGAVGGIEGVKEEEEALLKEAGEEDASTGVPKSADKAKKNGVVEGSKEEEKSKKPFILIKAPLTSEDLLNQKRAERQKRFGISACKGVASDSEVLQKRAERFKNSSSSGEALEARKKRFGSVVSSSNKESMEVMKAKRAKRFALST